MQTALRSQWNKSWKNNSLFASPVICRPTYIALGLDASITYKRNPNSNAKRKADGRDEARIIELACSQPPEGRARWTLRLLEEKSRVVLDTPIGKDAIRDILKKRNLNLT